MTVIYLHHNYLLWDFMRVPLYGYVFVQRRDCRSSILFIYPSMYAGYQYSISSEVYT